MKIQSIGYKYTNPYLNREYQIPEQSSNSELVKDTAFAVSSEIVFAGMPNINKAKKAILSVDRDKILRVLKNILNQDYGDFDEEEIINIVNRKAQQEYRRREMRILEITDRVLFLKESSSRIDNKAYDEVAKLFAEFKKLANSSIIIEIPKRNLSGEKMDYQLLNKFKSSILRDDFDLYKVFEQYYSGLKDVESLEELAKKYPKLKIPPRPEKVVVDKLVKVLSKDFYLKLDKAMTKGTNEDATNVIMDELFKFAKAYCPKYKVDFMEFSDKIAEEFATIILEKYSYIKQHGTLNSIPNAYKLDNDLISKADLDLLFINFDDFVLSVLKEQYLNLKKLSQIVYKSGDRTICPKDLRSTKYKFDKVSEKVKKIMSMANEMRENQRKYKNFDVDDFKTRLNYYAENEIIGNDDLIFDYILKYDTCLFDKDDKILCSRFLQVLDDIFDKKVSLDDGKSTILEEWLKPKSVEKKNALERKKLAQDLKAAQKKSFEIQKVQRDFDDAIDCLYRNNLNASANICYSYQIDTANPETVEDVKNIIKIISKYTDKNGNIKHKSVLDMEISRWDIFNYYKKHNPDNPVFKRALSISVQTLNGEVDISKAGQYLINSEAVESCFKGADFSNKTAVIKKLAEKFGDDKEKIIEYLFKYDNYLALTDVEKTKIQNITDLFDIKNSADKILLKYIIENDYVNSNTSAMLKILNNDKSVKEVVITAGAKQQIIDKYKFPTCLEYFRGFEFALSNTANAFGSSGVKMTGSNNKALTYKMELKIKGHNDRLFSSKNDYVFDIFSPTGLH